MTVKFAMASDPRYLPVVRGAMGALTAAIGWDEADCRAIVLAVDEALTNIIRHAPRRPRNPHHPRRDGGSHVSNRNRHG
jgi:anti-sigma regulatory factor (Ser/Thr protein kinase)